MGQGWRNVVSNIERLLIREWKKNRGGNRGVTAPGSRTFDDTPRSHHRNKICKGLDGKIVAKKSFGQQR